MWEFPKAVGDGIETFRPPVGVVRGVVALLNHNYKEVRTHIMWPFFFIIATQSANTQRVELWGHHLCVTAACALWWMIHRDRI